jgi:hypothetical protein
VRDIHADRDAAAEHRALGFDSVPVAIQGDRRLEIYHVDQLRDWLGLAVEEGAPGYLDLVAACERVLKAVERAVLQVPEEHLGSPTPNRGRDVRELTYNIHAPLWTVADSLDTGVYRTAAKSFENSRYITSVVELAEFARVVRQRWLARALRATRDEIESVVATRRGDLSQLQLLDFQARHAAGHLRQLYVFLRGLGIEPARELTAAEMAPISLTEDVF